MVDRCHKMREIELFSNMSKSLRKIEYLGSKITSIGRSSADADLFVVMT